MRRVSSDNLRRRFAAVTSWPRRSTFMKKYFKVPFTIPYQFIIYLRYCNTSCDNKLVAATCNEFLSYILREKCVFLRHVHNFPVYNDATQLCRLQQEAPPDIECIINNRSGESRSILLDRRAPEYSTRNSFCRWRGRSYLSHPSKTGN